MSLFDCSPAEAVRLARSREAAEERADRLIAELEEVNSMTLDQLRAEARRMVAEGGFKGELAALALEIDAQRTWGAQSKERQ